MTTADFLNLTSPKEMAFFDNIIYIWETFHALEK